MNIIQIYFIVLHRIYWELGLGIVRLKRLQRRLENAKNTWEWITNIFVKNDCTYIMNSPLI